MITVKHHKNKFTLKGHANFDRHGKDIVCASVSVLVYSFIESIEKLTSDKIEYTIQPGWVEIEHGNLSAEGKLLTDSFFVGIKMIADQYPAHVRIV